MLREELRQIAKQPFNVIFANLLRMSRVISHSGHRLNVLHF